MTTKWKWTMNSEVESDNLVRVFGHFETPRTYFAEFIVVGQSEYGIYKVGIKGRYSDIKKYDPRVGTSEKIRLELPTDKSLGKGVVVQNSNLEDGLDSEYIYINKIHAIYAPVGAIPMRRAVAISEGLKTITALKDPSEEREVNVDFNISVLV